MKKLSIVITSICFLTSCAPKIHEIANGRKISDKQLKRRFDRAAKNAMKQMSKEDLEILNGVEYYQVDTIRVSGN
ncbi:MAG: hypothetical protein ACKOA1_00320 [Bacteroidota bacterium]